MNFTSLSISSRNCLSSIDILSRSPGFEDSEKSICNICSIVSLSPTSLILSSKTKRVGLLSSENAMKLHLVGRWLDELVMIGPVTHQPKADRKAYGPSSWHGITSIGSRARGQFPPIRSPTSRSSSSCCKNGWIFSRYVHFRSLLGDGISSLSTGMKDLLYVLGSWILVFWSKCDDIWRLLILWHGSVETPFIVWMEIEVDTDGTFSCSSSFSWMKVPWLPVSSNALVITTTSDDGCVIRTNTTLRLVTSISSFAKDTLSWGGTSGGLWSCAGCWVCSSWLPLLLSGGFGLLRNPCNPVGWSPLQVSHFLFFVHDLAWWFSLLGL